VLDIFSLFRRKRRVPSRRRKPASGNWREELDRIGGLIGAKTRAPAAEAPPRFEPIPQYAPAPPRFDAPPLQDAPLQDAPLAYDRAYAPAQQQFQPQPHPEASPQHDPHADLRAVVAALRRQDPNQASNPAPARPQPTPSPQPQRTAPPRPSGKQGYLAAHGIEKSFGTRKVVKGASLYVRRGEAVGILGPNGAGKTTMFYMITGLIKADRGRIELDGNDVTALPMYQRARLGVGYLPQEASIFRGLNVEENIRAVLEVVEPDRKRRERDLDALLEEFNITRLRKSPSIALSGGERRRVEIARALASRPSYMLLDEPFAGIDPIAVGDIQTLVHHLTQRGIGVLITDHNVRETLGLTDRAYIIYSGEVLMEGRPDDIVNNPDVRRLYLGEEFRL
jgi:lipopolysaccharide export system ATP-binding protein